MDPEPLVSGRTIPAGGSVTLDLRAASGISQLRAGLLSVTVENPAATGSLRAYPASGSDPNRALLSFTRGITTTASVLTPVDADGRAALKNPSSQPVTVDVDLQSVFASAAVPGGRAFVPLRQARLVDTRENLGVTGTMTAGRTAAFQVLGKGRVPLTDVAAVLLQGMAVNPSASTTSTIWADGAAAPSVTQLSPQAARPGADMFVVQPGADGKVAVRNGAGTTDMTFDVTGYFR
jgi:hypothetical protein